MLLLASGASGVELRERTRAAFARALALVCGSLAHQIVDDGEGVGHVVTLEITGAATVAEREAGGAGDCAQSAEQDGVVERGSELGEAAGGGGVLGGAFDPARVTVWIGEQVVFEQGMRAVGFDEAAAHAVMQQREYTIRMALGEGEAGCRFLTCDLTEEYVRINADYST